MFEVENIQKSYEKKVIDGLSFRMNKGEIIFVTGPSGCGKTTLMRLALGLEKPDEGSVKCTFKKISAVFQEDRLLENLDIMGNIRLVSEMESSRVFEEYRRILPEDSFGARLRDYSGGMKRRAAILRAVLSDSEAVFMDEPFKGLDEKSKLETMQYVLEKRNGRALFIITHDMSEAEFFKPSKVISMK